jgi:hypothetical protein
MSRFGGSRGRARRLGALAVLAALAVAQASCTRLACEWEWRTTMAARMDPARGGDRATERELKAGREAFKQDFLEMCGGS